MNLLRYGGYRPIRQILKDLAFFIADVGPGKHGDGARHAMAEL
jgi:hypothetical protein